MDVLVPIDLQTNEFFPMNAATGQALTKPRILIVEDESIIAQDIEAILGGLGYLVSGIASSSAEALAFAAAKSTDLVLMDIRIKGNLDGIQAAEQIRDLYRLPVVYLSAHTDDATLRRAQATGPFAYLAKPVTAAGLKVSLAVALERQRLQVQVENREDWFHSASRNTGDAIFISDTQGRVFFVNKAAEALTGISPGAASGRDIEEVLRISRQEAGAQPKQYKIAWNGSSEAQFLTALLRQATGRDCPVLICVARFWNTAESGYGTVAVVRDISDLHDQERQLREQAESLTRSNDSLELLSHFFSHDLKEPRRNVRLYSQLLMGIQELSLSIDARDYLQRIENGCQRMSALLSSMIDYASAVVLDSHLRR